MARSLTTGNQRSVWLWQAYGTEQLNAGRLTEAVTALERARAILPLAETCATLAKAHLALGNSDAARKAAHEAVTRDPTWMPYRELFGVILFEAGQLDAAAAQFEAALVLVPEDARLHAQLAVIRQRQGQTPRPSGIMNRRSAFSLMNCAGGLPLVGCTSPPETRSGRGSAIVKFLKDALTRRCATRSNSS